VEYVVKKAERDLKIITESADSWVDEPVEVYLGIPMNPSYMDGVLTDRKGLSLTLEQQAALQNYRQLQREQWYLERKLKEES
jgi:hypothetical protein